MFHLFNCSCFYYREGFVFRAVEKAPTTALVGVLVDGRDARKVSISRVIMVQKKILETLIHLVALVTKQTGYGSFDPLRI